MEDFEDAVSQPLSQRLGRQNEITARSATYMLYHVAHEHRWVLQQLQEDWNELLQKVWVRRGLAPSFDAIANICRDLELILETYERLGFLGSHCMLLLQKTANVLKFASSSLEAAKSITRSGGSFPPWASGVLAEAMVMTDAVKRRRLLPLPPHESGTGDRLEFCGHAGQGGCVGGRWDRSLTAVATSSNKTPWEEN
jgi:hypothetical protein